MTSLSCAPAGGPDRFRPRVHLTAPSTWMNDPNGLIRHRGRWHAFYQNNPFGSDHAHMTWAHATSEDLLQWTDHGPAIPEEDGVQIFSGSTVHDRENTSGLGVVGSGPLVAIYTAHSGPEHPRRGALQDQRLAVSLDEGATWTKQPGAVLDRGSANFRDPKVMWHEPTGCWVMLAVEAEDRELLIHTSTDLRTWELTSRYRNPLLPEIWECPDLVQLTADRDPWLLILSTNPGGPVGGSGTWGLRGDFDGREFTPSDPEPFPLDHGPDFYAAVSFSDVDAPPPLILGWASNWEYTRRTPTSSWRGAMSLPRRLHAAGSAVLAEPVLPAAPTSVDPALPPLLDPAEVHVLRLPLPADGYAHELTTETRTELRLARSGDTLRLHRAQTADSDGEDLFPADLLATAPLPVRDGQELVLILNATVAELVVVDPGRETAQGTEPADGSVVGQMATALFFPAAGDWTLRCA